MRVVLHLGPLVAFEGIESQQNVLAPLACRLVNSQIELAFIETLDLVLRYLRQQELAVHAAQESRHMDRKRPFAGFEVLFFNLVKGVAPVVVI